MAQAVLNDLDSATDPHAHNLSGEQLESVDEGCQRDSGRRMLVPNHHDTSAFNASKSLELETIPKKADIPFVRMEEIHGPILGLFPVIAKRSCKLEFQSPTARQ